MSLLDGSVDLPQADQTVSDAPQAPDAPSGELSTVTPDPELTTYASNVYSAIQGLNSTKSAADSVLFTGTAGASPADAARNADTNPKVGDTWAARMASALGFKDSNEFAKAFTSIVAGAAVGAAKAYADSQKLAVEKQLAQSQVNVNNAAAATAQAKLANQSGIAGMKITPGGLINAPWKSAPIVPVTQRT